MRTTSSLESMNSVLGRGCRKHPQMFKFIDHIRKHEFGRSLDLLNLFEDDVDKEFKRKRQLDREREEKISYFTKKLQEGEITVEDFLDAMSDKNILPGTGKFVNFGSICPSTLGSGLYEIYYYIVLSFSNFW